MTADPPAHDALSRIDRLPPPEASLLQALAVHRWFDQDIAAYTAANLAVDVSPEQLTASPLIAPDRAPYRTPGARRRLRIRPQVRAALHQRMRQERPAAYEQAHLIAATYFHQPLTPLRTDRLTWYVDEIRHLAAIQPQQATERLAAFAHDALIAGYAEAAGRAAAELAAHSTRRDEQTLTGIIEAVAGILSAPAQVDRGALVALDELLARHGPPGDPAATRLVVLARDLVVYYTERAAPLTPLTALVIPDATATVDPRGMPVLGGELRLLEDLARPSRTITLRTQRVDFQSSTRVRHHVLSKLATEGRAGRTMVLADLLPASQGERLDHLRLSERGARPVDALGVNETVRALAHGVGRLLDTGEQDSSTSGRAELSRRLVSLGWHSDTDDLNALLQRTQQSGEVEDFLQRRIAGVMRYTPVVALLDVYPGLPTEVSYDYMAECTTRRSGLGQVVVTVPLTVPPVVRNRLEFRTPPGLVAAGVRERSGAELVPVRSTHIDTPAVQQFDVQTGREPGEDEDDGTVRIEVDLGYRLPDREFNDVLKTAILCMVLSLAAVFLTLASTALLSVIGTILASLGVLVDLSRDLTRHDDNEPLHLYAGKTLRGLRQSNAYAAIAAVTVPNAGILAVSAITSAVAFLYCFATCLGVLSFKRAAHRPLSR